MEKVINKKIYDPYFPDEIELVGYKGDKVLESGYLIVPLSAYEEAYKKLDEDFSYLIGKSVGKAFWTLVKLGKRVRIIRNGSPVTFDLVFDRVNLYVSKGKVRKVSNG